MRKSDLKVDNTFTISFHNIPKDMESEVLGRAFIGLNAAGLNVQFSDLRLRMKIERVLKNKNGSFSAETFHEPVFLTEVS